MVVLSRSKKIALSAGAGLVVIAAAWYCLENLGAANRPFVLIKDWQHNGKNFLDFSYGAQWVHHQCHEPLMSKSPLGNPVGLAVKDVLQIDAKTWEFTVNLAARFSDGTEVKPENYEKAWLFRKEFVKAPLFLMIDDMKALDEKRVRVNLKDLSKPDMVTDVLTSMWITPLKDVKGSWSWEKEINGPCEGPFVPTSASFDTLTLKRNKYWHKYDAKLLRKVAVLSGIGSRDTATQMFESGKLTYVDATIDPNLKSDFSRADHSFLEPAAWYILINHNGSFSEKLMSFPHHVINRGDLESVISGSRFFKVMYGILPLSFVTSDGQAMYGSFVRSGPESLLEARRDLGISEKATPADIKSPFNRAIQIYAPDDNNILPIVKRFEERLTANFNIRSVVTSELKGSNGDIDLAFVKVDFARDVTQWAQAFLESYQAIFPMPNDTKAQFTLLSKMSPEQAVVAQQAAIIRALDAVPLQQKTILPVGQFASAYLLTPAIAGVKVRGDGRQDPDISDAAWLAK
jgi:hypothetical protein